MMVPIWLLRSRTALTTASAAFPWAWPVPPIARRSLTKAARFSERISYPFPARPGDSWSPTGTHVALHAAAQLGQFGREEQYRIAVKTAAAGDAPAGFPRRRERFPSPVGYWPGKRAPWTSSVVETNMSGFRVLFIHSSMDCRLVRATPPCPTTRARESMQGLLPLPTVPGAVPGSGYRQPAPLPPDAETSIDSRASSRDSNGREQQTGNQGEQNAREEGGPPRR